MDTEIESINKRKQLILDCLDVHDFKAALEHTTALISKRGTLETTFRAGAKIMAVILTNITREEVLVPYFKIFEDWYDYCLSFNQILLTRNNLIYHGIAFTKGLIGEKCYDLALIMLDKIQESLTFLCDMSPDPDNERYIKYMAPLSYNSSLKKELINEEPEIAIRLYVHGVKFYLKYQSNFYILLDSIRSIELSFVKSNLVEKFYTNFFEFLKQSILNDSTPSVNTKRTDLTPHKSKQQSNDQTVKQVYLFKFYSALYFQYVSICYNSHLSKEKESIRNELSSIQSYFLNDALYSAMKRIDPDIKIIPKILNIFDKILNYLNQYQKVFKQTKPGPKSSKRNDELLDENTKMEQRLDKLFNEIYTDVVEKGGDSFYQTWLLNYLFEIIITGNSTIFNDSVVNAQFLQESQVEFLINITSLHAKTVQKLFKIHHQPDKTSKSVVIKPLSSFLICEKLVEQSFKMTSLTSDKTKWVNSETGTRICEKLIKDHTAYILWLNEHNLITNDEVNRVYNALECQTIRLCSQFYSEEILGNYMKFQRLSFEIAIDRLKFFFTMNKTNKLDPNNLKSFRSISDNLLLSYRLKDKFEDAFDAVKSIYEFLCSFNIEFNELEWLVTTWCKIKRDLWKAKNKSYQKITIASHLNIKNDSVDKFLLEEIRIYSGFKAADSSVAMNDEIYYTLEKLESLNNVNSLLKCRILIEIAQFTYSNYKDSNNKFKLSSEDYIKKAQFFLNSHQCLNNDKHKSINDLANDIQMIEIDDNKENDLLSPVKTPTKLNPLSPNNDQLSTKKTTKQTLNRKRKLQNTRSPLITKNKTTVLNKQISKCNCVSSQIIQFQLDLFKALNEYAKQRTQMSQMVCNLIQARSKVKENVTTNADQIQVQSMSSGCLICPDLCDETNLKMSDDYLISQLDSSLAILERIVDCKTQKESFISQERSLKKQFYESADLLAQLYGFFGLLAKRIQVFNLKIELLSLEFERNAEMASADFETIYVNGLLQLMKAYLNTNMCDEFAGVLLKEKVNPDFLKMNYDSDDALNSNKKNKNVKKPNKTSSISFQELENIEKSNKIMLSKPEAIIVFYLVIAHYLILKHKIDDALKLIKTKIVTSSILTGKQTAYFYEVKYYLKYLQFILSMSNVGKSESKLNELIENETPLSILEECYTSSFSVAKYYLQSSFEPSRSLHDGVKPDEPIFFNIGNPDCYRILSESLDIMQETCKYYIEISRYRDALGYIREGLDITQLHFSNRRISLFLLHQINADLIASCFTEATTRLNVAQNLIGYNDLNLKSDDLNLTNDLSRFKNYYYYNNLKMLKDIKLSEQSESDIVIDSTEYIDNFKSVQNFLNDCKPIADFCTSLTIENHFIICNYLKSINKSSKEILSLVKKLKEHFIQSDSKPITISERWYLAQFYCLSFELDSNVTNLNTAYSLIRSNPHPVLYRRICYHLFQNENLNNKLKIEYLLETQSVALRHKACSIQIKNKRKSLIDPTQFDKITSSLMFNAVKPNNLYEKIEKNLPNNFIVVSLVLFDSTDLYVVRLESGTEPLIHKLQYDKKYTEEFKQIINENDRSMKQSDRNKFWTTRSLLNTRLATFTEEIEKNVLSYAKSLLLGSFKDFNLEKFLDRIKSDLLLGQLSKKQFNLLKIIVLGLEYLEQKEIKEALKTEFDDSKSESISNYLIDRKSKLSNLKRKHVCLLVDKHLHQIPWESLPSAKKQSITRMPSIHFLLSHLKLNKLSINKEKAFYIVDPGGDLVYTKQKFQPFFEKRKSWKGIIGVAPDETQFKTALTDYELFIYTGHGSGSQYYPSDEVQKLRIQACSILMGCSSGNQYVLGDFEPYGTVLAYIIAGCPCIVGNLWDVTDRDIDRLTEEFLDSWLKDSEDGNENAICMSLNKARNGCKMTFLNGSAPIVYGLPVNLTMIKNDKK